MDVDSPNVPKPHFRGDGVLHATVSRHRFHLRRASPGDNLLWIDGRQPPYLLDRTAADFVTYLIEAMWRFQRGDGDETPQVLAYVVDRMHERYARRPVLALNRVTKSRIESDLHRLYGTLMSLAEGRCPAELGVDPKSIDYAAWSAPARMDLAVTYRCNLRCEKCYVGSNEISELTAEQWIEVLAKLWEVGVPQVVFTGGEPTLRPDLERLVSEAEEFVTGLVTNGTSLEELAEGLQAASLDYIQVTIESHDPAVHDAMTGVGGSHAQTAAGIREALALGMDTVTNTTLTRDNAPHFAETVRWLVDELGVRNIACNTLICSGRGVTYRADHGMPDDDLSRILEDACRLAMELGASLQWYSPTCYTTLNPVKLGLGPKSCSAAAHNMTVQPDGTVLPCQSWPSPVGSILADDWKSIWRHDLCVRLRGRQLAPDECHACRQFEQCGGGCPLDQTRRTVTEQMP